MYVLTWEIHLRTLFEYQGHLTPDYDVIMSIKWGGNQVQNLLKIPYLGIGRSEANKN